MKIVLSIIYTFFIFIQIKTKDFFENEILVLNEENFNETISRYDNILIKYYVPWCVHCKKLDPEYNKAAEALKNQEPRLYLAKVDASINRNLARRMNIHSYPNIQFYSKGDYIPYQGPRIAEDIIKFMIKKTSQTKELKNKEEIDSLYNKDVVSIVFFGDKESNQYKIFNEVSMEILIANFFIVNDKVLINNLGYNEGNVVIYKYPDEKNVIKEEYDRESLRRYIIENIIPVAGYLSDDIADILLEKDQNIFFYIRSVDNPDHLELEKIFKNIALYYKGKIFFIISDTKTEIENSLLEFLKIKESDIPLMWLIKIKDSNNKYDIFTLNDGPLSITTTEVQIKQFVDNYLNGLLKRHYRSQAIPIEQNEAAYNLVGKTFNHIVINSSKNVLVEFYDPLCNHCQYLAPIYEKIAIYFKDVNNILITKIDYTTNEVEGIEIKKFPTIKFYSVNDKTNPEDVEFANLKILADYLNNKLGSSIIIKDEDLPIIEEEEDSINETDIKQKAEL
jgi:protein disulfide-isomerase A1